MRGAGAKKAARGGMWGASKKAEEGYRQGSVYSTKENCLHSHSWVVSADWDEVGPVRGAL